MQQLTDLHTVLLINHRYPQPPVRVFEAWVAPQLAGLWLFATASRPMAVAVIDACNGGVFRLIEHRAGAAVEHRGRYIEIRRPHRLAFELHSPDFASRATHVTATFTPCRDGCNLELMHDAVPADRVSQVEARWAGMLYGLGVVLARTPHKAASNYS